MIIGTSALLALSGCKENRSEFPGRGWVLQNGNDRIKYDVSGMADISQKRAFTLNDPFRIASITKLVVAMVIHDLAETGLLDLHETIGSTIKQTPQNLTLAHLLSHQSGLRDPDIYWADATQNIRDLFSKEDFTHAPGTYFRYANLNYGLIATVVEHKLERRFDHIISNWCHAHGLDIGLNWSGVSKNKRQAAAALYRRKNDSWQPTIDSSKAIPESGALYLGRDKTDLTDYEFGKNGTLFSPQGGMRMSLADLIKLGQLLHNRPLFHQPLWAFQGRNGDDEDLHFLSFGPGSYIYSADISPVKGVPLIGHLGWAYGAHTGLFIVPGTNITFAMARLGSGDDESEMTRKQSNQFSVHQTLFDELAPTLKALI